MTSYITNYFNFKNFEDVYLITNDAGKFLFLNNDEFQKFRNNDFEGSDEELKKKLSDNYFISTKHRELFVDEISSEIRRKKGYLFESTQLHIFVLTNECNQKCIYCQASANSATNSKYMNIEIAEKAVDIALQSSSRNLTFEFQGGEPLLNFPVLKQIVEYTKLKNNSQRSITFNLVSNIISLDESMLDFLQNNNVSICTSIDGSETLHRMNRPSGIEDYYDKIRNNITRINKRSMESNGSFGKVQAIQTTTKHSLKYPKEIVDEYIELGFNSIFLRPLTPLGFAQVQWKKIGYSPEEFLTFYIEALEYIIELAISGANIKETYATILLQKILGSHEVNYMELRSPCGGAIGQLAYHYNGEIFTCDEGRMLSESGDDSFILGDVYSCKYSDLIKSPITKALCIASCLESIPGCQECVYNQYCGICPIYNYVQGGSIFTVVPANYKCKINKRILDFLFGKIKRDDKNTIEIFNKWIY